MSQKNASLFVKLKTRYDSLKSDCILRMDRVDLVVSRVRGCLSTDVVVNGVEDRVWRGIIMTRFGGYVGIL